MYMLYLISLIIITFINITSGFRTSILKYSILKSKSIDYKQNSLIINSKYNLNVKKYSTARHKPLKDLLGLGPAEIAVTLVVALVLFGPETLKSLSKDVGRAAAELKEIPKTFKEGMEEGQESAQVAKMKAIAAEKRKKRDEKISSETEEDATVSEE